MVGRKALSVLCVSSHMSPLHHLAVPHLAEAHLSENGPRETQSTLTLSQPQRQKKQWPPGMRPQHKRLGRAMFSPSARPKGIRERT